MSVPAPSVAVVIATHNRSDRLTRLLEAVQGQTNVPPFGVVIVDDASTDDTPSVLARLAHGSRVPLTVERLPRNRGPATARNVGWRCTQAAVVAFTDDDC